MADFKKAYAKTAGNEGGYSNVPGDTGGVTYCGITYRDFPNWSGWPQVKAANLRHGQVIPSLHDKVEEFYKVNFWDKVRGDEIADQEIAEQVYDMAVNAGVGAAAKLAHETVGKTGNKFTDDLLGRLNGTIATVLLFLFLGLPSCREGVRTEKVSTCDTSEHVRVVIDSVHHVCDTVYQMEVVVDTVFVGSCDSLAMRLRAANFRLNSIKHYVNICNRNPSQDKFLRGWINRRLK